MPLEEAAEIRVASTPASEEAGVISPDGRYIAYQSDESGGYQTYLQRFPEGEGKWQVSPDGGGYPRWSSDGKELYYRKMADNSLRVVSVRTGATLSLGASRLLISGDTIGAQMEKFDVSPDGKWFALVLNATSDAAPRGISVVQNLHAEFQQKDR